MHHLSFMFLFLSNLMLTTITNAQTQPSNHYDPMLTSDVKVTFKDLTIHDEKRERDIPLRVYLPDLRLESPRPIVLHSHGLGGSRRTKAYFGQHLAKRGYVVVFMQHAGSDEDVHKHLPREQKLEALKKATGIENTLNRIKDVHFVIDTLEVWHADEKHFLHGKLNLEAIAMTGHSYGAGTTQHVSGQWNKRMEQKLNDTRIKAAVVMSPIPGKRDLAASFGKVKVPWLLLTGTKDGSPLGNTTPEKRTQVFKHLPKNDKYLLVFWEAEHHAFTEGGNDRKKRNPNHHPAILALSTAFLDAYLKKDEKALKWLHSDAVNKDVLQAKDHWEHK